MLTLVLVLAGVALVLMWLGAAEDQPLLVWGGMISGCLAAWIVLCVGVWHLVWWTLA